MSQSNLNKLHHNGVQFIKHIEAELGLTMFYTLDLMEHTTHELFRSTGSVEDFQLLIDIHRSEDITVTNTQQLNEETISQVNEWILWAREGVGVIVQPDLQVKCVR
ncbi:hypothetical protein AB6D11_06075 [Vibrio splendidus]